MIFITQDFKSRASANSAIPAYDRLPCVLHLNAYILYHSKVGLSIVFSKYFLNFPERENVYLQTEKNVVSYCIKHGGGAALDFLLHYDYRKGGAGSELDTLYSLTDSGVKAVVCRIRQSSDNVMFVHQETTMSQLCACDEYVQELRFCEIDALMRLCGYRVLTLDQILGQYEAETPLILHFRSFRPGAEILSRIMRDSRFTFATDSPEQLSVIAQAFPEGNTVGFACHLPTAEAMARAGASAVCMYGREVPRFRSMNFSEVRVHCPVWYERLRVSDFDHDTAIIQAHTLGFDSIILPPSYLDK